MFVSNLTLIDSRYMYFLSLSIVVYCFLFVVELVAKFL